MMCTQTAHFSKFARMIAQNIVIWGTSACCHTILIWSQQAREIEFDISSLKSISGSTAQALKQIIYMEQDDQI